MKNVLSEVNELVRLAHASGCDMVELRPRNSSYALIKVPLASWDQLNSRGLVDVEPHRYVGILLLNLRS